MLGTGEQAPRGGAVPVPSLPNFCPSAAWLLRTVSQLLGELWRWGGASGGLRRAGPGAWGGTAGTLGTGGQWVAPGAALPWVELEGLACVGR